MEWSPGNRNSHDDVVPASADIPSLCATLENLDIEIATPLCRDRAASMHFLNPFLGR